MEILILIGIFAFVVAILFRSNEALDRVGAVEKEVKTLESEAKQEEIPKVDPVTAMFQEGAKKETLSEPAAVPTEAAAVPESNPERTYEPAFAPVSETQIVPAGEPVAQPAAEVLLPESVPVELPVQPSPASPDLAFPSTGDVHMN